MIADRPVARFDDLRAGTAIAWPQLDGVLVAHRDEDVAPLLAEVDELTRAGRWAFGFVSYEAAPGLDRHLVTHAPVADGPPLAWFGIAGRPLPLAPLAPLAPPRRGRPGGRWRCAASRAGFSADVAAVRRHIGAGEVYQCNLTTHLLGEDQDDPLALYAALAGGQGGAHAAYLDLGRHAIACASPELFFELRDDRVLMRPMKGTSPRGHDPADDTRRAARVTGSAKERAENVMIVDLVRTTSRGSPGAAGCASGRCAGSSATRPCSS